MPHTTQPYPARVSITEVGLRDGLQMESEFIPTATKLRLLESLMDAGIRHFEATSFVSPRAVPQLRDAAELLAAVRRRPGVALAVLAPNWRGVERAIAAEADEAVVFVSASESHNRKNLNRGIADSLADIREIAQAAAGAPIRLKGAIACAFGCPFEGDVQIDRVLAIAEHFAALGFAGITLGDTTGMATPPLVAATVDALQRRLPGLPVALHFHNTRGLGLANVMQGLSMGVLQYESSLGGIGGCPFAPGATGNVCTEDTVHLLQCLGVETGIDLERLIAVAHELQALLGRDLPGQVMRAGPRLRLHPLQAQQAAQG
ncbi:hydroxymethylglutaryl-CoA lyase [Comamonas humi]